MKQLRQVVLHPFLMAVYPILALLAHNMSEMVPWSAFRSLVVSLLLAIILFITLSFLLRNPYKAGILVTLFLFLFYSYGHIYAYIEDRVFLGFNIGRHRILLLIWLGLACFFIWWVIRIKGDLYGINQGLNVITILALVFPVIQLIQYEVRQSNSTLAIESTTGGDQAQLTKLHPAEGQALPDIYYIILDGYTRQDTLDKYIHYDNSPFLDRLTGMGFYVARCSQSNYSITLLSLSSSLNMDYLDRFVPDIMTSVKDPPVDRSLVMNNEVIRALRGLGYKIVDLESGYAPTELRNADVFLSYNNGSGNLDLSRGINPFESLLLRTTLGLLVYEARPGLLDGMKTFFGSTYTLHRNRILFSLDELPKIPEMPGPKFVFAHILLPHKPFVFGPGGQILAQDTPFSLKEDADTGNGVDYITGYRWQVEYLNSRVEPDLRRIIATSKTPPIIIVQGDHGPTERYATRKARMTILNAYYLPDGGEKELYPSISPVNSFRVVFDYFFNGQLDLLKDVSYYYDLHTTKFTLIPNERVDCMKTD